MSHQTVISVEFLGGLDAIFGGQRRVKCILPQGAPTVTDLLHFITSTLLEDAKDLDVFIQDGSVRPGILVLINDTDWELEGKDSCVLETGDVVTFTSTLHGG